MPTIEAEIKIEAICIFNLPMRAKNTARLVENRIANPFNNIVEIIRVKSA